jgi:hypothetical protein
LPTAAHSRGAFISRSRASARLFHFMEILMCWIATVLVLAPVAALCAYRNYFGKWPLKLNS